MTMPRLDASKVQPRVWLVYPNGLYKRVLYSPNLQCPVTPKFVEKRFIGWSVNDAARAAGIRLAEKVCTPVEYQKLLEYEDAADAMRRRPKPADWGAIWDLHPVAMVPYGALCSYARARLNAPVPAPAPAPIPEPRLEAEPEPDDDLPPEPSDE